MTEREAFEKARGDETFRKHLISKWKKSKTKCDLIQYIAGGLFLTFLLFSGIYHGRWSLNLLLLVIVIVAAFFRARAVASLAALEVLDKRSRNEKLA